MSKLKLGQRIEVEWDDSFRREDSFWHVFGDLGCKNAPYMKSVGYYLSSSKRFLTVAQTVQPGDDTTEATYGATFSIPQGCIHKIKKI